MILGAGSSESSNALVVPHGAAPAEEAEPRKPALPKPVKTPKPVQTPKQPSGRELQDYSYELSPRELDRVRRENPLASATVSKTNTLKPLSWDEYDALTADQRAAVDFNSALVEARERDLKTDDKWYTKEDRAQFAKDVEEMFGAEGGSAQMAPATMALLKKINFKAVGQDLDEFLSLERGIGVKELKNFQFSTNALKQLDTSLVVPKPPEPPAAPEAPAIEFLPPEPPSLLTWEEQLGLPPLGTDPTAPVVPGTSPAEHAHEVAAAYRIASKAADDRYAALRTPENMAAVDTAAIKSALEAYRARVAGGAPHAWSAPRALSDIESLLITPIGYGRRGTPDKKFTDTNGVAHSYEEMLDMSFKDAYSYLMAHPDQTGLAALFQDFKDRDWSEEEQQQLWDYINNRTMQDVQVMDSSAARAVRTALGWK